MQVGGFIFIERKWESDKKVLNKMVNYFTDMNHKTQVIKLYRILQILKKLHKYSYTEHFSPFAIYVNMCGMIDIRPAKIDLTLFFALYKVLHIHIQTHTHTYTICLYDQFVVGSIYYLS